MTEEKSTKKPDAAGKVVTVIVLVIIGAIIFGAVSTNSHPSGSTVPATATTEPQHTDPAPEPPKPINLSGTGNMATDKFQLISGLATFKFSYTGESNFIVYLLDNDGNKVELVANEINSSAGSKATNITASGTYLLDVEADGPWTVDITQ